MRAAVVAEATIWHVAFVEFVVFRFEIVGDEVECVGTGSRCRCDAELEYGVDLPGMEARENSLRCRDTIGGIVADVKGESVGFQEFVL